MLALQYLSRRDEYLEAAKALTRKHALEAYAATRSKLLGEEQAGSGAAGAGDGTGTAGAGAGPLTLSPAKSSPQGPAEVLGSGLPKKKLPSQALPWRSCPLPLATDEAQELAGNAGNTQ